VVGSGRKPVSCGSSRYRVRRQHVWMSSHYRKSWIDDCSSGRLARPASALSAVNSTHSALVSTSQKPCVYSAHTQRGRLVRLASAPSTDSSAPSASVITDFTSCQDFMMGREEGKRCNESMAWPPVGFMGKAMGDELLRR